MIELSSIHPHEKNPRRISDEELEQLKNSIKSFEKMMSIKPMIIDENRVILSGNQRHRALLALGHISVPNKWVKQITNLSETEKKEFMVRDNISNGVWDFDSFFDEYWENEDFEVWLSSEAPYVPDDVDLDKFFEKKDEEGSGGGSLDPKHSITLDYTEDDYRMVIDRFNEIGGTKEQTVWYLLGLDKDEEE